MNKQLTEDEIRGIVSEVKFYNYQFKILNREGEIFLQAEYEEPDILTGKNEIQKTRKYLISKYAVESEITQTCFKCAITSMEHRTREHFTYKGRRVYSPHFDVNALIELCDRNAFDEREDWYANEERAKAA